MMSIQVKCLFSGQSTCKVILFDNRLNFMTIYDYLWPNVVERVYYLHSDRSTKLNILKKLNVFSFYVTKSCWCFKIKAPVKI